MLIKKDNLLLREATLRDLDSIMKWEQDSYNSQFVAVWSEEKHRLGLEDDNLKQIIIEYDGKLVGYFILQGLRSDIRAIELMRLVVTSRDKGIGRKTIEEIVKYTFDELEFNKIWLDVRANNERGKHLYDKIGFIKEGTIRDAVIVNGQLMDIDIMSILKSEYSQSDLSFDPRSNMKSSSRS